MMRLALFQPDIPQNTGAVLRLAACLGVAADIIEPCGFVWSDRRLRRSGMDYMDRVSLIRHASWQAFLANRPSAARLVLLTTRANVPHTRFAFRHDDILLLGRESSGVPDEVHGAADARIRVPVAAGMRALNVAVAAAIVLGEALRQCEAYPVAEEGGGRDGT